MSYIQVFNAFFMLFFTREHAQSSVLQEKNDGDLCCSRFGTTKYACLKCKIPICNKCSISKKMFIFGAHDLTINLSPKINFAQFVTLDLRNISNLLDWICVTFPICYAGFA